MAGKGLYGGLPEAGPPGFAPRLLEFADELRREGMAVGTSELLDAFSALEEVSWENREDFREALAATLAKSQEDRRVFELIFDRFFFRAVEREAVEKGLREQRYEGGERLDLEELRARIRDAIRQGSDGEMRDLARLAIAAFGRQGEGSGVIGVDVQRIRRTLGLKGEQVTDPAELVDPDSVPRERLREFERHLRRELERATIERTESLPPAKPLREYDRALPSGPLQDLAAVHRVVAQMKRRLATLSHEKRGRRKGQIVDVRRTMRASLETGGVPLRLRYRPKRPKRPEIYVLCDVSTSVTSASVFFLSVLHALHDAFRRQRSFVFVERISEVTDVFERERSFAAVSHAIATDAGVADVSGYTDYGRVWLEFLDQVIDELDPRSTVIVLGDARTNGREPHARAFGAVAERAGRMFWLNPEPKLYWNYGDSVMSAYEPWCDGVFECWTTKQLETFVNALAGQPAQAAR
ncbi:MAG: VWA domain-containing protein [Thermoleophilaceae bacterium]